MALSQERSSEAAKASIDVSEAQLISRILNGEVTLFSSLYAPCHQAMLRETYSVLGNRADAEDAVQEAALKAFRSLAGFRHEAKFRTWLVQIAINEARAILRRSRRHPVQSIEAEVGLEGERHSGWDIADDRAIPSEMLLRSERYNHLSGALRRLSPAFLSVLQMRDIEGLSTEETARVLGLTLANVKTRLSRARHQIRNAFNQSVHSSVQPLEASKAEASRNTTPSHRQMQA